MSSTPVSKPPYLLGILCLIPLVGALVGIALLLYAIFKYKDKWLALIGVFGIVFTVGLYSFLFYNMRHGESSKKGFAMIAQMQLNSLIKNIEFYNIQHGHYPENLTELLEDDKLANIYDPTQVVQGRENPYYNYKRVANKYSLSSSGPDGIQSTPDDIFPEISIGDSTKIGLIK